MNVRDIIRSNLSNDEIRSELTNVMSNHELSTREVEIDNILRLEKEQYDKQSAEFYANPKHWDNNKRRRHGLPPLRGNVNKYRLREYKSFKPTPRVFFLLEDIIDEVITSRMHSDKWFNQFVEVKNIVLGDAVEYGVRF